MYNMKFIEKLQMDIELLFFYVSVTVSFQNHQDLCEIILISLNLINVWRL